MQAFAFLVAQVARRGDVVPFRVLREGFTFDGRRVPLLGPEGIFKPAVLPEIPLTLTTAPPKPGQPPPYDDHHADGVLRYRYRGTDPNHPDNVGLRRAMQRGTPLIYLFGVVPGEYIPVWPVFIVADAPDALTFSVAIDDPQVALHAPLATTPGVDEGRRSYVTRVVQQRLHQQGFRVRVLHAYRDRCAVCRLRHTELLEAAHILPDGHPDGRAVVPNGLALCKLHHAAFDRHILGIRPDHVIELRHDILAEEDGPMLRHGLQQFQGARIEVPGARALRPDPDYLATRFELFQRAG
jgi:putative restriction endonuclease